MGRKISKPTNNHQVNTFFWDFPTHCHPSNLQAREQMKTKEENIANEKVHHWRKIGEMRNAQTFGPSLLTSQNVIPPKKKSFHLFQSGMALIHMPFPT